jgi:hypothetical protein
MFFTICEILSYSVLIFCVIFLVGYWTGANYYFKLNSDLVSIFIICNAISWFFWCFINILGLIAGTHTDEFTHNLSFGIVGTVNMICIVVFIGMNIINWFEQSRKYFWKKRGR